MSEPIAVAFVEVRPEADEFRTDVERQLGGVADDFEVRGNLEVQGLADARRDVAGLQADLAGIGGQQLQFEGLEDALQNATGVRDAVRDAANVSVGPAFQPLLDDVRRLRAEADQLVARLQGNPVNLEVNADLTEAINDTSALEEASVSLNDTLGTSATAAGTLIARSEQLAAAERQAAAATAASGAAARQASVEEERLFRVRSRRASSVAPFRLAGVGLLAGTALFSATRALGELTDALEVTGNEATTTEGKLRNVGASLLGGDLIGAFKALTNETRTYSAEQLKLIDQTPELEQALIDAGRGGDLLKSRLTELAKVSESPVPQFIQTQIAVAREQGDPDALRAALERASASIDEALKDATDLRGNQKALLEEVKRRREELAEVRDEIERLSSDPDASRARIDVRTGRFFSPLDDLIDREEKLAGELSGFADRSAGLTPAFNAAREALANAKREQKAAIDDAIAAQADDILAPLAEAVTDARLTGDSARIKAALQRQANELREIIAGFEGSADDRKRFKEDLLAINREIEATQRDINAEAERHRQAMIDNRLAVSEEAIIDAELAGAGVTSALQARANDIQAILDRGTIGGKRLSRDQRISLKNELVSVNGQIEAEQDRITAENKRHADAMKAKLGEADDAFLRGLGQREQSLRNQQALEQARAGLEGDIRVSEQLQQFYRESIKVARRTINDKKQRDETVAQLQAELTSEAQNERALRQQQRIDRREVREEKLDLAIDIASSNENRAAEIRARQAKIAFLREQIESTRRGSIERKRLRAEIARERAAIRDLRKDAEKDDTDAAGGTTLADLFTRQADLSRQAGFDAGLPVKTGDFTQRIEDEVTTRLNAEVTVKSPLERSQDKVVDSNTRLTTAIERLTATIPNLTGSTLGQPRPSRGDVEGARWNAAARFWESERGRQLAQETASA